MRKSSIGKIIFFSIAYLLLTYTVYAQEIIKVVYVGDNGITEDVKEAHSFILVKQYPGNIYERLDYKLDAPLTMLRTYNDSNMSNLNGKFLKYDESGVLKINGQYSNNQKSEDWLYYNDSGRVVMKEIYDNNVLIRKEDPDTLKKNEPVRYGDEKEAEFGSDKSKWLSYLQAGLTNIRVELRYLSGSVHVMFTINTEGKTTDIYLKRSALFRLDEEAIQIIRLSPLWKPAFQNGHKVSAYRVQPFTFVSEEIYK